MLAPLCSPWQPVRDSVLDSTAMPGAAPTALRRFLVLKPSKTASMSLVREGFGEETFGADSFRLGRVFVQSMR